MKEQTDGWRQFGDIDVFGGAGSPIWKTSKWKVRLKFETLEVSADVDRQLWIWEVTVFAFLFLQNVNFLGMSIQEKWLCLSIGWSTLLACQPIFQNVHGIVSIGMCDSNERLREGKAVESKWTQLLNCTQFPRRGEEWFTQFDVTKVWLFSFVTWPKSGTDSGWVHIRA